MRGAQGLLIAVLIPLLAVPPLVPVPVPVLLLMPRPRRAG